MGECEGGKKREEKIRNDTEEEERWTVEKNEKKTGERKAHRGKRKRKRKR